MKKIGTYYFLLLAALNMIAGYGYGRFTSMMLKEYARSYDGALPQLTAFYTRIPWWPYVFVALCILGIFLGLTTKIRDVVLMHFVILILMAEGYLLFMASIAFAVPFISIYVH